MLLEDKNTKLIDGIRKAVETFGSDYKYKIDQHLSIRNCIYFEIDTEEPSCLIGHGIASVGYTIDSKFEPIERLKTDLADDQYNIRHCNAYAARHILTYLGFDSNVVNACNAGQTVQDAGDTWGEALQAIHDSLVDSGVADQYWR